MENGSITRVPPPYQYEYLKDPLNIRILVLIPAENRTAAIECELEEWTMTEWSSGEKQYEAFSWCWNQGSATRSLRIHTPKGVRSFEILVHLYEGFQALRDPEHRRYIWVDGLCIWQAKAKERNQQVPRMKDIYGQASNVCIWLGAPKSVKEKEDTELAFNFVGGKLLEMWDFDTLCTSTEYGPSWAALLELMKKPWFSRRWIVQEISLAKRGIIYCGNEQIAWQTFADAVSLFVQVEETLTKLSQLKREANLYDHHHDFFAEVPFLGATLLVQTTNDIFQRSAAGGHYKQRSLESPVARLAIFQSSEPRDTVYGLLGMAKDSEPYASFHEELRDLTREKRDLLFKISKNLARPSKAWYTVSYKSQVIDVYQEFIAFTIRNANPHRALDIICRPFAQEYTLKQDFSFDEERLNDYTPEQRAQNVTLPSWVPNIKNLPFAMRSQLTSDGAGSGNSFNLRMTRVNGDSFVGAPEERLYNASGSKTFSKDKLSFKKWKPESNGQGPYSMFVEGFILDTVGEKAESAHGGNIPPSWPNMIGWTDRKADPPDDLKWDAFWRTLVANRGSKGSDPPIYFQRACKEIFQKHFDGSLTTLISNPKTPTPIVSFLKRVQAVMWGRCLFETREKRLGLATEQIKPTDEICILYGCSVPVVLRKVSKREYEIKREEEEDKEDHAEFEKRSVEKLKRVFASRKAARNVIPSRLKSMPRLKNIWQIWNRYRLLHFGRVAVIAILATWMNHEGETLTAILISLIALCYFLSYSKHGFNEPKLTWWTPIEALTTIFCIFLVSSTALAPYGRPNLSRQVWMVSAGFVFIFPQLLHLPARDAFIRARDVVERKLVEIETSETESLSDPGNLHWRVVDALRNWIRKYEKQMPRRDMARPAHYYRLIGECYVHGMMDGEAIRFQSTNDIKTQVFEIR